LLKRSSTQIPEPIYILLKLKSSMNLRTDAPTDMIGVSCKRRLQQYGPEVASLVACLAVALSLRLRGSMVMDKNLAEIMKQWPMLITADTLLALQAMLRLLVLISSVLRSRGGPTLISQEAAAISCGAALGRAALLTRSNVYFLDGPLGGHLPVTCELLSVPLLLFLCRGLNRRAFITSSLTLIASAWIASRNRLALANDVVTDGLFVFAHIAELIAAFAFLSRALVLDVGLDRKAGWTALHFAHIVMPVQQCLAAYYFVQAFEAVPELVSAGHPFEILQMGGIAQVAAYAGAAILHLAEYVDAPSQERPQPHHVDTPQRQRLHTEAITDTQSVNAVPGRAAVRAFAF